jgi:iron complex outermembrane receptor protein
LHLGLVKSLKSGQSLVATGVNDVATGVKKRVAAHQGVDKRWTGEEIMKISRSFRAGLSATVSVSALFFASASMAQTQAAQAGPAGVSATSAAEPAAPASSDAPAPAAAAASSNAVGEVVVTGFRNSLAKAINLKRQSTSEIDTILAEDIGKFPDLNLAESLQRIPGVAITREGGEGRQITVRGLGPQYTRTTINGMEALSTIGSPDNDGGVNRTRAFDFTVFASDLFNQLSVHKTAEGDVSEGSLGATVDLHTARPFDYKGFTFIATAKGDYNDLAGSVGPRGSMIISDRTDDGKFGALVSLSYSHRKFDDDGASTVRWDEGSVLSTGGTTAAPLVGFGSVAGTNCQVFPLPAPCAAADSALHPRFPRYDAFEDDQQRFGATVSLQWKPDERDLFSLDYLHSYYGGTRQEQYLEAPGFSGTGKCASPTTCTSIANIAIVSDTINSQNVMTAGTFNGVDTRVEDRFDKLSTNFDQITLTGVNHWTDKFSTDELLGVSSSFFNNPVQTTLGFDQYNVQGFSYNYANGNIPMLNFGSANLTANGPWVLTEVRERPQSARNDYETAQFNAHYTWSENLRLSAGVEYKVYTFKTTSLRLVNGESVGPTGVYASLRNIPISSYSQTVNASNSGINAPAGSATSWITPSVAEAQSALGIYSNSSLFALSTTGDLGDNAGVKEKDTGVYVQADFDYSLLGRPLRGNVGMRGARTDETSVGYEFISNVLSPLKSGHDYDEGLPSANLVWELRPDFQVRFGASRVMARPDLTSLVGSTSVTVSGTSLSVKTGNPDLKPFLANSYDLAFEWYPMRGALVSLALFRKDIISLVTTNTVNIPFHGNPFGIPDSAATQACGATPGCNASDTWAFSVPTNTTGGQINGLEINYQQPFSFLPWAFKHTGLLLNYTAVDSSVLYPNGTGGFVTGQLVGLSRSSANGTLYYEDDHWSARISESYRSRYLTRVPGQEVGTDADGFDPTYNLDASVQYTFDRHWRATLEGVNLTDQAESEFNDTTRDLSYYYHHTGREILFGLRYQY